MSLRHVFVSATADGPDASKLRPSDWNADHAFSGGALGSLLFRDTGASDGKSWLADVAVGSVLVSGGIGAAPAWSATPTLTDLTLTGIVKRANGSANAPSDAYTNSTGLGRYRIGADNEGFAAAGVLRWDYNTTRILSTIPIYLPDGLVGTPGLAFGSEPTLGLYRISATVLGVAGSLTAVQLTSNGNATFGGVVHVNSGAGDVRLYNAGMLSWSSTGASTGTADLFLVRDAANTLAQRNGTTAQRLNLGQGNTSLAAGRLAMGRDAAAAFAPGAGYGMLRWETGTNANTLKLVAYSGTSTTGVTVVDNVGGGN